MMKKIYVNEEELNEEEKKTGYASYATIVRRIIGDKMILCNNIVDVDPSIWDTVDDLDNIDEIYQYYLCNVSEYELELNKKMGSPLIFAYSEKLGCDVLLVDHFGTGWDYVLTNVEWTTDLKNSL